jgi:hypothetical protein
VLGGLSNVKMFLRYALLSITESAINNPDIYNLIFYNMSSVTDYSSNKGQDNTASSKYGQQQQQNSSPDFDTEANAAIIIDEAKKLFYKLVKDSINNIPIEHPFRKSSSSLPLLPPSNEEQQSHVRSSPTAANQNHEEYTFIQSEEIDNDDQENKSC